MPIPMNDYRTLLDSWVSSGRAAEVENLSPEWLAAVETLRRRFIADSVRKHAVHNQTDHGNWARHSGELISPFTGPLTGAITPPPGKDINSLRLFPKDGKKGGYHGAVVARMEHYFGPDWEQTIKQRYTALIEDAVDNPDSGDWAEWYTQVHDDHHDLVVAHNSVFSTEQAIAMTAAMSPGRKWERNYEMTQKLVEYMADDVELRDLDFTVDQYELLQLKLDAYAEKYGFEPVKVTAALTLNDIPEPNMAALAFDAMAKSEGYNFGFQYGYSTAGDGIRIARGEDPDGVLRGAKTRSFYNNMLGLPEDDAVTIDIQMFDAALGRKATKSEESNMVSSPSFSVKGQGKDAVGIRPAIADIVRDLTDDINAGRIGKGNKWGTLLPRDTQAIIWMSLKDDKNTIGENYGLPQRAARERKEAGK